MLTKRYADELPRLLLPIEKFHPFPTAEDRSAWEGLASDLREAVIALGDESLKVAWPSLHATLFMEYRRTGNRSHYERFHFQRRRLLQAWVLAECIEGRGRFLDALIDGIWSLCEESFWGVPAHNLSRRFTNSPLPVTDERIIDLFAGETAGLLVWTHYLLSSRLDRVAPVVCDRIRREVRERILDPYLERDDFWWMALDDPDASPRSRVNNWNPWCNSNCLTALLILEEDPARRLAGVEKAMRSLDRFIGSYHPDGGCDEGPSYWGRAGASLFDCLELLHAATDGKIDRYGEPLIANMGRYLYRAYIGGNYFLNFADAPARVEIPADLVHRYGRRIGDPRLMALGSHAHHRQRSGPRFPDTLPRALPAIFNFEELDRTTDAPPRVRDVWLEGTQWMVAREREGSEAGLYLAVKGGHNDENHNHNDVGHFVVYRDGRPILIDIGVETYTAKTFSARRYEIWTMQSAFHNLPIVEGIQQAAGRSFHAREVAYRSSDSLAEITMDLAEAYPKEAGIERWRRTFSLERSPHPEIRLRESFRLARPSEVTLNLIAALEPESLSPGRIRIGSERGIVIGYPEQELEVASDRIELTDERLRSIWGDRLFRIRLTGRTPVHEAEWSFRLAVSEEERS